MAVVSGCECTTAALNVSLNERSLYSLAPSVAQDLEFLCRYNLGWLRCFFVSILFIKVFALLFHCFFLLLYLHAAGRLKTRHNIVLL